MAIIDLTQKDWKSWFKENWDIIGVYDKVSKQV